MEAGLIFEASTSSNWLIETKASKNRLLHLQTIAQPCDPFFEMSTKKYILKKTSKNRVGPPPILVAHSQLNSTAAKIGGGPTRFFFLYRFHASFIFARTQSYHDTALNPLPTPPPTNPPTPPNRVASCPSALPFLAPLCEDIFTLHWRHKGIRLRSSYLHYHLTTSLSLVTIATQRKIRCKLINLVSNYRRKSGQTLSHFFEEYHTCRWLTFSSYIYHHNVKWCKPLCLR